MARKKTAETATIPKFQSETEEAAWWDAHPDLIVKQFEKAAKEGRLLRGIPRDPEAAQRLAGRRTTATLRTPPAHRRRGGVGGATTTSYQGDA